MGEIRGGWAKVSWTKKNWAEVSQKVGLKCQTIWVETSGPKCLWVELSDMQFMTSQIYLL